MNTSEFQPLPKKTFEALATNLHQHCVSIYLTMHKTGKEHHERLAQANLKSCIREVQNLLAEHQMHENEITNYLKPIENLVTDGELWGKPSDGLAIFLDKKGLRYFSLPIPFSTKTQVANHFYLTPLLPLYNNRIEILAFS